MNSNQELESAKRAPFWPLYVSIFLLMVTSVSAPLESASGTQSILPASQLTKIKLVTRAFCATSLLGLAFVLSYRKNAVPVLLRFTPIIAFCLWGLLSISWSALPRISLNQAGSFGILIVFAFATAMAWESEEDTKRLLCFLSLALLFISIMLLALRVAAPQYGALTRDADGLLHTTFGSSAASLGFLIGLMSTLIWGWSWAQKLIWVSAPIHIATILVSGSRMSLALTAVLGTLAIILFCRRETLAVLVFACGLIGTSYLMIDPGADVFEKGFDKVGIFVGQGQTRSQLKTLSGRTEMWNVMMNSHQQAPWKGHGYFCTSESGQVYVWYQWGNWTAHNMWLQLLVTTGWIGVAIFSGHLIVLGQSLARVANWTTEAPRRFGMFTVMILLWYLGWGLLNESIFGPTGPDSVVFFVTSGLCIAVSLNSRRG